MQPILLDIPTHIETPHLLLRWSQPGDGAGLHKAMLDGYDDLTYWLNWSKIPPSVDAVEIECRQLLSAFILRTDIRYVVIEKATQTIIGRCAYPSVLTNWQIPAFGLSYFLARSFQGKGYGCEIATALTMVAFKALNARRVEIKVDPDNMKSRRIPEKLNYKLEAQQLGCWYRSDKALAELWTYARFDLVDLPEITVNWHNEAESAP